MNKNFYLLQLLVLLVFIKPLSASHTQGADISYKNVGPNQFEVTLSFYRDCGGASTPGGCDYTFNSTCTGTTSSSCGNLVPVYFYMRSISCGYCIKDEFTSGYTVTEVTPICGSGVSNCSGGSTPGVEQWKFTKVVTLPAQCTDWEFIYGNFARNNSITTLTATNVGMFVSATLNNVAAPTNSSPSFTNLPVPYVCVGQNFCYNHGAVEIDGDSLVYQMVTPQATVLGATVNYATPYSATNPIASSPPLALNSSTGDICFTPTTIQVTVMAIRVYEYRNGVLIGSTVRDMQVRVVNCSNSSPTLSGLNGAPGGSPGAYSANICAGQSVCFTIEGYDPDPGDILNMSWNNGIPAGSFTVNNNTTNNPVGQF
jgi:hypothetical protein